MPHKILYVSVTSHSIHNKPKLETTQISFQGRMAKAGPINASQPQLVLERGGSRPWSFWTNFVYKLPAAWQITPKLRGLRQQQWCLLLKYLQFGQILVEIAFLCSMWGRWLDRARGFRDGSLARWLASWHWLLVPFHMCLPFGAAWASS